MPKLRVANITEESRYGGPQKRIVQVASSLKHHGIETTVICGKMGAERLREELTENGIPHRLMPLHRITRNPPELFLAILLFPIETIRLTRLLKRERFDLIHCNGSWQWKGILAGWLTSTPIVWHLNDTNVPGVIHLAFRVLSKLASGFIVAGDRVKEYYLNKIDLKSRPAFTIQAPVDCASFSQEGIIDAEIAALPGIKVLTIANINPSKGLDTMIRVAAQFSDRHAPEVSFVVIGRSLNSQKKYSKYLQNLKFALKASNVYILGPRSDIPACLRAVDIGLCCSIAEASPMAIWETAAAGVPIVATDVGDIARFNNQYNFAYTAPIGDHITLAKAISRLIENPSIRKELGENGKKFSKSLLDISECTNKSAITYRIIIAQTKR